MSPVETDKIRYARRTRVQLETRQSRMFQLTILARGTQLTIIRDISALKRRRTAKIINLAPKSSSQALVTGADLNGSVKIILAVQVIETSQYRPIQVIDK